MVPKQDVPLVLCSRYYLAPAAGYAAQTAAKILQSIHSACSVEAMQKHLQSMGKGLCTDTHTHSQSSYCHKGEPYAVSSSGSADSVYHSASRR